jgi:hypothetical protein
MQTLAQRKEIILAQMKQAEMYAAYWMHSATNGHASIRKLYHGDGTLYTADELRDEAMQTSLRHIHRMHDLIDGLHDLHDQEVIEMNRKK